MEDKLKYISSIVNEWLKFAEAKNAVLVALCSAGTWGFLQVLKDTGKLDKFKVILIAILLTLIVSLMISLFSFVARKTNAPKKKVQIENPLILNLLFFGHISKLNSQDYLKALYQKYGKQKDYLSCSSYEKDLANQIVINAEIATIKCIRFNQSVTILFIGIMFSIIGLIIVA